MSRAALLCILLSSLLAGAQIAPIPPGAHAPPEVKVRPLKWDWRHAEELTWKQSIERTSYLSPSERKRLLEAVASQISEIDFESEEDRKKAPAKARFKYVDLDGDGASEVIVQSGDETTCSPTGNCAFWVFRRRGNSYIPLLDAGAQTFTIQQSRTHGLHDIVLALHGSAFQSEVRIYRFDGESYQPGECYDAEWSHSGSDGESQGLKSPQLTPCAR